MKKLFTILLVLFGTLIYAQHKIPSTFRGKYHMLSPQELELKKNNIKTSRFTESLPPVAPIRNIAEFEPMKGVLVSYPDEFGISIEVIREMSEDVIVYTIVYDQEDEDVVTLLYDDNGVNLSNSKFIYASLDSYWSRDYTPWYIFDGNEDFGVMDFKYNRPRYNDNAFPIKMAEFMDENYFAMNIEHAGGNYMTDGMGISASTKLVKTENSDLTEEDIINKHNDFLGIKKYHLIDDPQGEYIQHIDCWGKFLAVDKILISKVPESDSRYNDYENIADFFANEISSYGTKYKVYRVNSPNGQPYTNSLILNKKVLVPIMSGYSQENTDALNAYKEALPGYEVIGIFAASGYPWEPTDALHCRTHGVPDPNMIYISHIPVSGIIKESNTLNIEADIITHSSDQLQSITLNYKAVFEDDYTSINMPLISGNTYGAKVDTASLSSIYYYIHVEDASGRNISHPLTGADDPHSAQIRLGPYFTSNPDLDVYADNEYVYEIAVSSSNSGSDISISCTEKPYWLSFTDNGDNTGILSGTPTFSECGGHNISLVLNDGISTLEQNYIITVKNLTRINRIPEDAVRMFPNPATDIVWLNLSGIEEKEATITVINKLGQVVWLESNINTMDKRYSIKLEEIGTGLFFVKIETKTGFLIKKLIVY